MSRLACRVKSGVATSISGVDIIIIKAKEQLDNTGVAIAAGLVESAAVLVLHSDTGFVHVFEEQTDDVTSGDRARLVKGGATLLIHLIHLGSAF